MPEQETIRCLRGLVELCPTDPRPLHRQLADALRTAARTGLLHAGTRLPSTRQLAVELGVSRGVAVEAYEQLVAEGYLSARTGSGTRIADGAQHCGAARGAGLAPSAHGAGLAPSAHGAGLAPSARGAGLAPSAHGAGLAPSAHGAGLVPAVRFDLRPGSPDLAGFPRAAWAAAQQRAVRQAPAALLDYGDPRGAVAARTTVAGYLIRTRAALADVGQVVLTSGFAQGLALLCAALRAVGHDQIALEDPSQPSVRGLVHAHGLATAAIPVDRGGADVEALEATGVRAVLLTPAHQFPTGVVLSPDRRAALLAWARRRDGVVIEDDYDAEYRYDRAPVGCLQGLDPKRVVHAGSVSKMLAPALRIGWLIPPAALMEAVVAAKRAADLASPALEQLAFADLIDSGALNRHLRRTRAQYRGRRDALVAALAERLPAAEVHGVAAGLHVVVELPGHTDERAVERSAAAAGVAVLGMHRYRIEAPGPPSLVLGYTRLPSGAIPAAVAALAAAVRDASG